MTLRHIAVGALAVAGCYSPKFRSGIACDVDGSCPSGLTCGMDSVCREPGTPMIDAALSDGSPLDAAGFETVITGLDSPAALILPGDGYVYYTSLGSTPQLKNGAVGRAAVTGGGADLVTGLVQPSGMTVAGNTIYWEDFDGQGINGVISAVTTGGTSIGTLARQGFSLANDGTNVYIVTGGSIIRIPVGALSPVTDVITGVSTDIIGDSLLVDASDLYWVEVVYNTNFVVVGSSVKKRAKIGGTITTLATDTQHIERIVMDSTDVYGAFPSTAPAGQPDNGAIVRVSRSGGGTFEVVAAGQSPQRVAIDDSHVYWTNQFTNMGGAIMRCTKVANCTPEVVLSRGGGLVIAVDATDVYWANGVSIFRKPKP